jgi:hypothetical protein
MLAGRAVGEGAQLGVKSVEAVARRLQRELAAGDSDAWETWLVLAELPVPQPLRLQLIEDLAAFSTERRLVGRALAVLGWNEQGAVAEAVLLEALNLAATAPVLDSSKVAEGPRVVQFFGIDSGRARAAVGAAERLLPRKPELAHLVGEAAEHVSVRDSTRLYRLLEREGHSELVRQLNEKRWSRFRNVLPDHIEFTHRLRGSSRRFLEVVSALGADVNLDYREARSFNSLAAICGMLRIREWSGRAWSQLTESELDAIRVLIGVIAKVGGLDPCILATEARLALRELDADESDDVFFMLFDLPSTVRLDNWDHVVEVETRAVLRRLLHLRQEIAVVAAQVLRTAPSRDQIIVELDSDLHELHPLSRRLAARVIAMLSEGQWITRARRWAVSDDVVLRYTVAEVASPEIWQQPTLIHVMRSLAADPDDGVRAAIISGLEADTHSQRTEVTRSLAEAILEGTATGWLCFYCGCSNEANAGRCIQCHGGAPGSKMMAKRFLG